MEGRRKGGGEGCESITTVLSMCIHCTEMMKTGSEEERNETSRGMHASTPYFHLVTA